MEERLFDARASEAFEKSLVVLGELGYKEESKNRDTGEITASIGVSWLSWGEKITIKIIPEGGKVRVRVSSSSNQLIDWGKNSANEKKLIERLDSMIG